MEKDTTPSIEQFAVLMVAGVRIRLIDNLAEGHLWLKSERLLFIDFARTTRDQADEVVRWILGEVIEPKEVA